MKKEKKNYGSIILIAVIIILFIPIISDYIKKQNIEVLSSKEITEKINNQESFIVYIGDAEKSVTKKMLKLRDLGEKNALIEYGVFTAKKDSAISDIKNSKIAVYIEGELQKTYDKFDNIKLTDDVNKYYLGNISDENKSYKVAENFSEYKNIVKSDEPTMAVFGRNSCGWCNKYKPVYNAIAEKYKVDIYYFDSDNYDSDEYEKIINMDLVVPAKCSSEAKEFKLSEGFGTPLTIFTKSGKVVDCIGGYKNRTSLLEVLKENKIISE